MRRPNCDILIIGGGPAGSCAAAFARSRGLSVCLVEKESFPRFHIGESLLPMGNAVLRAAGVWPKIEAAGFIEKRGARFCLGDGSREKRIDFAEGLVPGLERTYQVERARFDALLLDHARETGAVVLNPATVTRVDPQSDCVRVTVKHRGQDEKEEEISARWVIDAGGRDNLYAHPGKRALDPSPYPRRVAIYAHFHNLPRETGPKGGDITIVRLDDGWFWIIPIDAQRTSVGLVTTLAAMRASDGDPASIFGRAVEATPLLRDLFSNAAPASSFHVTSDYSYFRRELAFDRIVLVGDAGGFFDPIFSSGVYMAISSAQRAVDLIARAQPAGRSLRPRERRSYTRQVKRQARVFARLITAFYDNDSFAVFLSPRPPFDIDRGLNSIVAGHAPLTWSLRWRLVFFLVACGVQKRFRFVAPLRKRESVAASPLAVGPG